MEVPVLLRRMAGMPVSMLVGPTISLRQPRTSERVWRDPRCSRSGAASPPEVLYHAEKWERGFGAAASWVSLSDGCDGGIPAPYFREDVDESRDILGLGHSRPPEVLYHAEKWERGFVAAASWVSLSEGCDGGIQIWCVGFESALFRLFGLAGKVYAGLPLDGALIGRWLAGWIPGTSHRLMGIGGREPGPVG